MSESPSGHAKTRMQCIYALNACFLLLPVCVLAHIWDLFRPFQGMGALFGCLKTCADTSVKSASGCPRRAVPDGGLYRLTMLAGVGMLEERCLSVAALGDSSDDLGRRGDA